MSEKSTIANGLAWLLEHLLLGLNSHARHLNMPAGLHRLIAARLMRLRLRVSQLLARGPVAPSPYKPHHPANPSNRQPRATREALPTNFAWLGQLFPGTQVALARSLLAALLDDPETRALIASHPLLARSLRPLCHMLGLKTPFCLKLPRRPRSRKAANPPAAMPSAQPPAPRQPRTPRIFWRPAPPPPPMTPAEARYAALHFLNPREFAN